MRLCFLQKYKKNRSATIDLTSLLFSCYYVMQLVWVLIIASCYIW